MIRKILIKAKKNGHNKKVLDNWMYANSIHLLISLEFLQEEKFQKLRIN